MLRLWRGLFALSAVQPCSWARVGGLRFLVFPALLTSYSCGPHAPSDGEDDALSDHGVSVRDSAGILLVETPEALATAEVEWQIDSVPVLALGSEEVESEVFFGVQGLRGLSGGGVLVVDGGSRELRFFDESGHMTHRVGRKGEGPGEFDRPYLVQTLRSDSLLLWDGALKRFQVFTGTGDYARTIRLSDRWPMGGIPPLGATGALFLVQTSERAWDPQRKPGPVEEASRVFWYDAQTSIDVPITSFEQVNHFRIAKEGTRESGLYRVPFTTAPAATVTEASALLNDGASPEIREFDRAGQLRRIFRVPEFGRPVTQETLEGLTSYWMTRNGWTRDYGEWLLDAFPSIPDTLPAFRSLQVDEIGWIWAEIYHWDRTKQSDRWMIFDPEGQAHGILDTPDGLQIQRIGESFLLGVQFDDLGVEQVLRYSLRRDPILVRGNTPDQQEF